MGRPRNEPTKARIFKTIEDHYRSFFEGLGLRGPQVEEGLDYITRGYTKEAAAKIVLAGGDFTELTQGGKAA